MRNATRSREQLKKTSQRRQMVFEFMRKIGARELWTINGPLNTDVDEIMCFAYRGGVILVQTWEQGGGFDIYTSPTNAQDYETMERDVIVTTAERDNRAVAKANAVYYAPMLIGILKRVLVEVDHEIEQRQHGGNDEAWAELANISSTGHAILAMIDADSRPAEEPDYRLIAINAVGLLAANLSAWEQQAKQLQEQQRDLIARNRAALYGTSAPAETRIPIEGMTPDGFVVADKPLHLSKKAREEIERRGGAEGLRDVTDEDHPDCTTPREVELYDALMGLGSAVLTNLPATHHLLEAGGIPVWPGVQRALRL